MFGDGKVKIIEGDNSEMSYLQVVVINNN